MDGATLVISIIGVAIAAFAAWRAWLSSQAAEEANARAVRPVMTAVPQWAPDGQLTVEIRFDRDLDDVRILMERPEVDRAFWAFSGFIPMQPGLHAPAGVNGNEALGHAIRAGHLYGIWPHADGRAEVGRILLRAECTAGRRSWVTYADTGPFSLRPE